MLLDAGSTMGALADAITKTPELTELTVVTAGISAMGTLADSVGIDVIALGGRLRPLSQAFVGPLAEAAVQRLSASTGPSWAPTACTPSAASARPTSSRPGSRS